MNTLIFISWPFYLVLWTWSLTDAQRTPTISIISPMQTKKIGGTVELDCSVQYARDFPVLWIKLDNAGTGGHLIIASGSTLIIRDSRFSLRYDPSSSLYALQIKDLQESDAGTYQCQILISVTNRVSLDVDLRVQIPPTILDNSTQQALVTPEGETVMLECFASGYPQPRISWRRENNALLPTGGSIYRGNVLKILSTKKNDRGTYFCIAENGVGKGAKRIIVLAVEFPPEIDVSRPEATQALGYVMDLDCQVVAYPSPTISWLFKDELLSNNREFKITHFETSDEFVSTSLHINTVRAKNFGRYTCKAANKLGISEKTIELTKTDYAVCPPACTVSGDSSGLFASMGTILMIAFLSMLFWFVFLFISVNILPLS